MLHPYLSGYDKMVTRVHKLTYYNIQFSFQISLLQDGTRHELLSFHDVRFLPGGLKMPKIKAPEGFEPSISCLLDRRFNQLSHGALA